MAANFFGQKGCLMRFSRMRKLVCAVAGCVLTFAACGGTTGHGDGGGGDARVIRAQEGHACSTDPGDDPQLLCSPVQDLVCISTYSVQVTDPQEAMRFDGGIRQVFVCRYPCSTTSDCPQPGDTCCPGPIYGKTFDRKAACVPPGRCEAIPETDGGS